MSRSYRKHVYKSFVGCGTCRQKEWLEKLHRNWRTKTRDIIISFEKDYELCEEKNYIYRFFNKVQEVDDIYDSPLDGERYFQGSSLKKFLKENYDEKYEWFSIEHLTKYWRKIKNK